MTEQLKNGWVIEKKISSGSAYFCNGIAYGMPRWSASISDAHFWRTESGAKAAVEEWDFTDVIVAEHSI